MKNTVLNLIFPKYCISCNTENTHLCQDCLATIPLNTEPVLFRSSPLRGLFYAAPYRHPLLQRAIKRFKYAPFVKELAVPLAFLIVSHFALLDKQPHTPNPLASPQKKPSFANAALCPVPLSKRRLHWRGFNQAEELAHQLSYATGMSLLNTALVRTKHTTPQVESSDFQRKQQMRGIFQVPQEASIHRKRIFLVDDVFTTGATMTEAARALKMAGAKSVYGIAIARG